VCILVEGSSFSWAYHLSKVQEVLEWKAPKSVMQICSFLGLTGYYHEFIPNFFKIAKQMTKLLEKDVKFKWNPECK
jgi:hypothetical protein